MRLDAAIPAYLSHCGSERRLSALSVDAYSADLRDFSAHVGPDISAPELDVEVLRQYLTALNDKRKLSVATVRRRFATLQGFFNWLAAEQGIETPFSKWKPQIKRPKRLPRALQRPELSNLLSTAEHRASRGAASKLTFLALTFMAATGVRVSELCALTLEDSSPDGTTYRIRGKGSRDRVVYVSNEWLQERLAAWRQERAVIAHSGIDPFFVGRHGRRLNPAAMRGRVTRLAKIGGNARRVTPHMLRHTAATLLIEEGVDIRVVQRLLGHASIATTEIYTHVADETLRQSLKRADVIARVVPRR